MKVIEFIPSLVMAGAETIVKDYALRLDTYDDIELLVVVVFKTNSLWEKTLQDNGINLLFLDETTKLHKTSTPAIITGAKHITKLRKIIKTFKPDIFHYHLYISKYVFMAGLPKSTSVIYTLHTDFDIWRTKHPNDINFFKLIKRKYNSKLITLTPMMQQKTNEFFNINDSVVLNNGIDIKKFKSGTDRIKTRAKLGFKSGDFVIGNIGRFVELKNHTFLIDIFKEIHKTNPDSKLLLISGGGPLEDSIKKRLAEYNLIDDTAILYNRSDINDLLNAMDVFILTSKWEGLGIVLIEAQISGLWTIASNVVPESTRISNHIEYLDLSTSPKYWAEKILALKSCKTPIEYYGLENWEMDNVVKKLHEIYKSSMTMRHHSNRTINQS